MPQNLVQPVKGKTVQRVVIEMDAKGIASIEAKTFDPFGNQTAMNPLFLCSLLGQMLNTIISDVYRASMRGQKVEVPASGNETENKIIAQ